MRKTAHLLIALFLAAVGVFFYSQTVNADQLTNASLTLGDSRPTTQNTHTYEFTHSQGADLEEIRFQYCTTASGTCTTPTNLVTSAATKGTLSGITEAEWSLNTGTAGTPKLQHTDGGDTVSADTPMSLALGQVVNHDIDDCENGGDTSADTCYVRVTTYSDLGSTSVDNTIVTYTIVAAVTVTARVDPSFTFTVSSVAADDVNNDITTSAASTFSTLPFGNLTANTPRYTAHELNVTTNTQSGYTVTAQLVTQMTGVYSANNIDPFAATWGSPTTWTQPSGSTPNDNTAWFGANTTDTDVNGWDSGDSPEEKFGGIGTSTAVTVMEKDSSDDGSSPVTVTYGIEANVFQPADTYSGTLVYNAVATY